MPTGSKICGAERNKQEGATEGAGFNLSQCIIEQSAQGQQTTQHIMQFVETYNYVAARRQQQRQRN